MNSKPDESVVAALCLPTALLGEIAACVRKRGTCAERTRQERKRVRWGDSATRALPHSLSLPLCCPRWSFLHSLLPSSVSSPSRPPAQTARAHAHPRALVLSLPLPPLSSSCCALPPPGPVVDKLLLTSLRFAMNYEGHLKGHRGWVTSLACPQQAGSYIKVVSTSRWAEVEVSVMNLSRNHAQVFVLYTQSEVLSLSVPGAGPLAHSGCAGSALLPPLPGATAEDDGYS
ncbi:hypothetical protein Q4I30_005498, partial [Leishmania utingensis]